MWINGGDGGEQRDPAVKAGRTELLEIQNVLFGNRNVSWSKLPSKQSTAQWL